jgi:hypothetical protein
MCCTVLRVDEIGKPAGSPCAKLAAGGGCGIHETRPGICRAYRCAWLEGKFREEDRPDLLGAVVDFTPRGASFDLVIIESEPGRFAASARLQEIADAHRGAMPVRISDTTRIDDADRPFRVLLPAGEEHRVVGERVTILRDGVMVEERRLPWIERGVRRLFVRLRRLRLRSARRRSF